MATKRDTSGTTGDDLHDKLDRSVKKRTFHIDSALQDAHMHMKTFAIVEQAAGRWKGHRGAIKHAELDQNAAMLDERRKHFLMRDIKTAEEKKEEDAKARIYRDTSLGE